MSSHPIMAKIADRSDLGLRDTFESLSFKHINHRGRPSRKGFKRTELGRGKSANWEGLEESGRPGVEERRPDRSLLMMERERRDTQAHWQS